MFKLVLTILLLFRYTALFSSPPVITSIYPNYGPVEGGNTLSIYGTYFQTEEITQVLFGSNPASFSIVNDTQLVAIAPKEIESTVQISIITAKGSYHTSQSAFYAYQGSWHAYLISQSSNEIIPVNLMTHLKEPPISVGCSLAHMVIAPKGKMAYVTDRVLNAVIPFNLSTRAPECPIPVEENPTKLAIHGDGKTLYVLNEKSASLSLIDLTTHTIKLSIPIGNHPKDLAILFNGLTAYVCDGKESVIPINLVTNRPEKPILVGLEPISLVIDYEGQILYVLNKQSKTITPIIIATHTPKKAIPLTLPADSLTMTSNGEFIYAIHTDSNCITPISLLNNTALPPIPIEKRPKEMSLSPDGKIGYVVNEDLNGLTPITLETHTVMPSISTETPINSLVIAPDPSPIASYICDPEKVEVPTIFDASSSVTPIGTLAYYIWDFGDETMTSTQLPIVSHTYQQPGIYHPTLTVINSAGTSQFPILNSRTITHSGGPSSIFKKQIQILNPPPETKAPEIESSQGENELSKTDPLLPPIRFKGKVIKNLFNAVSTPYHRLKWKASPDPRVIGYKLYRNGILIRKFSKRRFFIFNQYGVSNKKISYSLIAFDKNGKKSIPLTLTIP